MGCQARAPRWMSRQYIYLHSGHIQRYVPGPTSCVASSPCIWRLGINSRDSLNEFGPFAAPGPLQFPILGWTKCVVGLTDKSVAVILQRKKTKGQGLHKPDANFDYLYVSALFGKSILFLYMRDKYCEINSKACIHWMQNGKSKEVMVYGVLRELGSHSICLVLYFFMNDNSSV